MGPGRILINQTNDIFRTIQGALRSLREKQPAEPLPACGAFASPSGPMCKAAIFFWVCESSAAHRNCAREKFVNNSTTLFLK